jgi:hypothetical protein
MAFLGAELIQSITRLLCAPIDELLFSDQRRFGIYGRSRIGGNMLRDFPLRGEPGWEISVESDVLVLTSFRILRNVLILWNFGLIFIYPEIDSEAVFRVRLSNLDRINLSLALMWVGMVCADRGSNIG